jgi:hypothetical protein
MGPVIARRDVRHRSCPVRLFDGATGPPEKGLHGRMGFDQYHEPVSDLTPATRTFARMIVSMIEEADAINWYQQRIAVETDQSARTILEDAQQEEFLHFAMDLEWLTRRTPKWQTALKMILFQSGDIVEAKEKSEPVVNKAPRHPGQ